MKKMLCSLFLILVFMTLVSCSAGYDAVVASNSTIRPQDNAVTAEPTAAQTETQKTDSVEGCETPLYFDSEEQFLSFMSELRSGDPKRKLTVSSRQEDHDRVYSASNDYFVLSGLGEVYAPGAELPGTHLGYISASNNYVCYVYFNEAEEKVAYLMWHRSLPAEYAYPEGVERTEYNGVEYAIEELGPIEEEAYPGGYVISWVRDNKSFRAEFLVGFTVDDMLAFCEYRSVPIK